MNHHIYSTVNGPIHYWVSERKDNPVALVFLHGLTSDHAHFQPQYDAFAQTFTMLAWDAPMHGASTPYKSFTFDQSVTHLKAILDDTGFTEVVLIGHSLGTLFAQLFITRYPEMVRGFLSLGGVPMDPSYYSHTDRWALSHSALFYTWMPEPVLHYAIAKGNAATAAGYDSMHKAVTARSKRALVRMIHTAYSQLVRELQPVTLNCPVLLAVGAKDHTGQVKKLNRTWAKREGLQLVIIPKAAHNANTDRPAYFNTLLTAFLQRLEILPETVR